MADEADYNGARLDMGHRAQPHLLSSRQLESQAVRPGHRRQSQPVLPLPQTWHHHREAFLRTQQGGWGSIPAQARPPGIRRALSVAPDRCVIGVLGRLSVEKG